MDAFIDFAGNESDPWLLLIKHAPAVERPSTLADEDIEVA